MFTEVELLQNLICSECGDEFVLQSQLSLHLEEHRKELSDVRVYVCKTCGKELKTFAEFRDHSKGHVKMRSALNTTLLVLTKSTSLQKIFTYFIHTIGTKIL